MQPVRARLRSLRGVLAVEQVPVDVVLEDEAGRVKPVVKDLAAHDVAADAPAVLVALVSQPVVAQDLRVKVVRLKGGVVHVALGALEEEEAVVVDLFVAAVQPEEDGYVLVGVVVVELFFWGGWVSAAAYVVGAGVSRSLWIYLAGVEVEVFRVELVALLEIRHAHAVMAQLVDRRRALLKPLELVGLTVLLLRL